MLPRRIPKPEKRSTRWRSQAHCNFVRSHACCNCGSESGIEVAHVRMGSGAGMGEKPSDYRTVSLCSACHRLGSSSQHAVGEPAFWVAYGQRSGQSVEQLIAEFIRASPKRAEIERIMKERAGA